MDVLRSECHRIYGQRLNKVSLSPFDSKRWIAENGVDIWPMGTKTPFQLALLRWMLTLMNCSALENPIRRKLSVGWHYEEFLPDKTTWRAILQVIQHGIVGLGHRAPQPANLKRPYRVSHAVPTALQLARLVQIANTNTWRELLLLETNRAVGNYRGGLLRHGFDGIRWPFASQPGDLTIQSRDNCGQSLNPLCWPLTRKEGHLWAYWCLKSRSSSPVITGTSVRPFALSVMELWLMPAHGPTSWCLRLAWPSTRGQKKSTMLSTPTGRSGLATTTSSRSATGRLSRSTLDSSGEGPDLVPRHWQRLRRFPPEVDGRQDLRRDRPQPPGRMPWFPGGGQPWVQTQFPLREQYRLDIKYLDRGRCYTIGFHHPNFHPMTADPPGMRNIQTADLSTRTPTANGVGLPTVPHQTVYSREDLAVCWKSGLRMADLSYISRTALEEAKAVIVSESTHPLNYGFILCSQNPEATGVYSDILCESPLLRLVRQLVYQPPSRQVREEIDQLSRLEYCALKA